MSLHVLPGSGTNVKDAVLLWFLNASKLVIAVALPRLLGGQGGLRTFMLRREELAEMLDEDL